MTTTSAPTKTSSFLARNSGGVLIACGTMSALLYLTFLKLNFTQWIDQPLLSLQIMLNADRGQALLLFLALVGAAALYLLAYQTLRQRQDPDSWLIVILFSLLFAGLFTSLYPFAAADVWDYIFHARILGVYGGNPYVDLIRQYPADPFYDYAFWKDQASFYGPVWVLISGLVARLSGDGLAANLVAFKLLPGIFFYASVAVVALMLRKAAPERALPATLLLAWNPMLLFETFGNGHNDIAMAFWMLLAAWMMFEKRYTLAVLALLMGALFKYIPVILLPVAGIIALRDLQSLAARLRYLVTTAVASIALLVLAYAPLWQGPQILTILSRTLTFRSSIASVLYTGLRGTYDAGWLSEIIPLAANLLLLAFILYQCWQAWRDRSWLSFTRASVSILLFYLLISSTWFMVWYPLWALVLAVLLPPGFLLNLILFFSLFVLNKQFILFPFVWWTYKMNAFQVELSMFLALVFPAWLYIIVHWLTNRPAASAPKRPMIE